MKLTKLQRISIRIAILQAQFLEEKDRLRKQGVGRSGEATVYRVRSTKVASYVRRGCVAVRVRKP